MTFRSNKDSTYILIMGILFLVMFAGLILPLILSEERTTSELITRISIFVASVLFILWFVFSMSYTLLDQHLLVKSAFIKSRIPYEDITMVSHINGTLEMLSGYQLLTSKKGIAISYKTGIIGSVKISPKEEDLFLSELKKRCAHIDIEALNKVPGNN